MALPSTTQEQFASARCEDSSMQTLAAGRGIACVMPPVVLGVTLLPHVVVGVVPVNIRTP